MMSQTRRWSKRPAVALDAGSEGIIEWKLVDLIIRDERHWRILEQSAVPLGKERCERARSRFGYPSFRATSAR